MVGKMKLRTIYHTDTALFDVFRQTMVHTEIFEAISIAGGSLEMPEVVIRTLQGELHMVSARMINELIKQDRIREANTGEVAFFMLSE
jgi:hypothetical protein